MLLALAGIATSVSTAGENKDVFAGWSNPGPPPLERFISPLALTAEQQKQLKPIFADAQAKALQDEKRAEARDDKATGDDILNQMVIRDVDFRSRLSAVLTPEQLAQYEALTEARAPRTRTLVPHPAHGHGAMEGNARIEHEGVTPAPGAGNASRPRPGSVPGPEQGATP
jgi:Spy/CpxP family protein refolding chaperone